MGPKSFTYSRKLVLPSSSVAAVALMSNSDISRVASLLDQFKFKGNVN